jgi:hypothetical protein
MKIDFEKYADALVPTIVQDCGDGQSFDARIYERRIVSDNEGVKKGNVFFALAS